MSSTRHTCTLFGFIAGEDIREGRIFTTTGQYMWIRFVTDEQLSTKGFLAKISATPSTGKVEDNK